MNIRRKNRLWIACAVLAGLALTIGLVLYALRSNIDLFYTPGEILYGKRETQQMPEVGQRLRVGGMVMPGSVQRDPNSLKVTFTIYDAEGSVDVSYEGILPDLFREGQGVVVQGELEKGNHILAKEVLTERELDVLHELAQGLSNKQIASVLNISEQTVKVHIRNLLRKLNVRSRVAATILFLQQRGAQ